jgi:IPT/TIG domain/PASTA domain
MKCRHRHEDYLRPDLNRGRRKPGRVGFITAVTVSACALMVSGAQASTITVGSVLPPGSTPTPFGQVQTQFNTALPEKGANLTSPVNGAIVRWRVQGAEGGPFFLRVLRPNGSGAYAAVGTSNGATPSGTGVQTFNANLPIRAGDLIGIDPSKDTDTIGVATAAGASYGFIFPPPLDGATVAPSGGEAGKEIELSAEVQPAPAISSIAPASASIAGGAVVTITGTNFNAASAVKFGSTPATGFTVDSDTQITATAPAGVVPGTVDVTVTTLAGTSPTSSRDLFTYIACVVPKLKGKALKPSRRAVGRNECKLGKVTRRRKGSLHVVKQSPKPGTILAPGSKVNVTLGR